MLHSRQLRFVCRLGGRDEHAFLFSLASVVEAEFVAAALFQDGVRCRAGVGDGFHDRGRSALSVADNVHVVIAGHEISVYEGPAAL